MTTFYLDTKNRLPSNPNNKEKSYIAVTQLHETPIRVTGNCEKAKMDKCSLLIPRIAGKFRTRPGLGKKKKKETRLTNQEASGSLIQAVFDSQHKILSVRTFIKACLFWMKTDTLVNEFRQAQAP